MIPFLLLFGSLLLIVSVAKRYSELARESAAEGRREVFEECLRDAEHALDNAEISSGSRRM